VYAIARLREREVGLRRRRNRHERVAVRSGM
jgi:hypothetical protein